MILILLCFLSLIIWLFLLLFWGNFWQSNQLIEADGDRALEVYPTVWAIVPARDEAEILPVSLASLLKQDYLGDFFIVLVDDNSCDRTLEVAQLTAEKLNKSAKLNIISGQPLADGWKGKLWAMQQGIDYASQQHIIPNYFLLTDADIKHDIHNLNQLVTKAETENLDLVSLMVLLRCQSIWEKLLIPAFVFFFQKLYPFPWVNNQNKSLAAAAGGCILISSKALSEIGGIATIKDALIDDCSLAKEVKSQNKNIWLGLTETTTSLRAYDDLKTIWDTIARTAFTQLNYSLLLLIGTIFGMSIVYLAAPVCLIIGILTSNWLVVGITSLTWLLMSWAYFPTIKLYNLSMTWAFSLPAIAFLYTLMTIDSAIKYWQGKGGAWKGRTYERSN
ncbi:MAG: glycosyltransferase [Pleurocapsa sp. MO_192.B19]|nr:glycosyltransferase [Pleurocapsa sp. MO_192.B19]